MEKKLGFLDSRWSVPSDEQDNKIRIFDQVFVHFEWKQVFQSAIAHD